MDCDPAVAADRHCRHHGGAAVRGCAGLPARAQEFLGQGVARWPRASAAGAAPGRYRLSAPDLVREARADRELSRRLSRHRVLVPMDGRSARMRGHGLSAAGAPAAARHRGDRPQARGCRRNARRRPPVGVSHGHPAARAAGIDCRHGALLRQGTGRVRRDHHLRVKHSRRDADHLGCDLHLHPDAGRRRSRGPPGRGGDRDLA